MTDDPLAQFENLIADDLSEYQSQLDPLVQPIYKAANAERDRIHDESVAKIRRAIGLKQGLSCIFGSVGFGKSSLLRYLASGYDHDPNGDCKRNPKEEF